MKKILLAIFSMAVLGTAGIIVYQSDFFGVQKKSQQQIDIPDENQQPIEFRSKISSPDIENKSLTESAPPTEEPAPQQGNTAENNSLGANADSQGASEGPAASPDSDAIIKRPLYGVHIATYVSKSAAKEHVQILKSKGIISLPTSQLVYLTTPDSTGKKSLTNIIIGPLSALSAAERIESKLHNAGQFAQVIMFPEGFKATAYRPAPKKTAATQKSPKKTAGSKPQKAVAVKSSKKGKAALGAAVPIAVGTAGSAGKKSYAPVAKTQPPQLEAPEEINGPLDEAAVAAAPEVAGGTPAVPDDGQEEVATNQESTAVNSLDMVDHHTREYLKPDTEADDFIEGDTIMNVMLRGNLIYQGMLCFGKNNTLFIPLSELASAVQFPITVTAKEAFGWFLHENKTFNFNPVTGEVVVANQKFVLDKNDYFTQNGEQFIAIDSINRIFDLNAKPDYYNLTVRLKPSYQLPLELARARQHNRRIKGKEELRYPLGDLDYAAAAPPQLNIDARTSYASNKAGESNAANTSVLYRGDLLFMSTSVFGAASISQFDGKTSDVALSSLSATGERLFTDNPVVSKVTVGDITPVSTALGSGHGVERGVVISNQNLFKSYAFDTKTFAGKALPGWDVELYNNRQLVGFQTVAEDGAYLFEDIELKYGNNHFELVLYGPEGQKEVREEDVTVGGADVPLGQVGYDLSVSQQGDGVFDDEHTITRAVKNKKDQGEYRVHGRAAIGLPANLQMTTTLGRGVANQEEQVAGSVDVGGSFGSTYTQVGVSSNNNDVTFGSGSVRGLLPSGQNISVGAQKQISTDYVKSSLDNSVNAAISDGFDVVGTTRGVYSVGASRSQSKLADGDEVADSISLGTGLFSEFANISNNISSSFYEQGGNGKSPVSGSASAYRIFNKGTIRGTAHYNVDTKTNIPEVEQVSTTGTLRVTDRVSTSLSVSKNTNGDDRVSASNQWNYYMDKATLYARMTADNESNLSAQVGVSVSLGFTPDSILPVVGAKASYGGASCFVYLDNNYNNVFDEGDKPLENVAVQSLQNPGRALTNERGNALLYRLALMKPTDIEVMVASLPNPQMSSAKGHAITPRAGKLYELEFPIHLTGEIEGKVYLIANNEANPVRNAVVQLLDADNQVVKEMPCEEDGYFLFSELVPGKYTVRMAPEYVDPRKYAGTPQPISLTQDVASASDVFVFYGDPVEVEATADSHRRALMQKRDVQLFAEITDMDTPMSTVKNTGAPELLVAPVVDAGIPREEVVASVPAQPELNLEPVAERSLQQNLSLLIEIFQSEKSALRALKHFKDRYNKELEGYNLEVEVNPNGYSVVVHGIPSKVKQLELANVLLCQVSR